MIMKPHLTNWIVGGAMGAGLLAFAAAANASGSAGSKAQLHAPSPHVQLAVEDCRKVIKAAAMKDDKMASDTMKDDKMASDTMKDDKMAKDAAMKDDKMAADTMKEDEMAKNAADCADKDTM